MLSISSSSRNLSFLYVIRAIRWICSLNSLDIFSCSGCLIELFSSKVGKNGKKKLRRVEYVVFALYFFWFYFGFEGILFYCLKIKRGLLDWDGSNGQGNAGDSCRHKILEQFAPSTCPIYSRPSIPFKNNIIRSEPNTYHSIEWRRKKNVRIQKIYFWTSSKILSSDF